MCITGPSAGENRWMEVDGESRKAVGFPLLHWVFPDSGLPNSLSDEGFRLFHRSCNFGRPTADHIFPGRGAYPARRGETKAHRAFVYFTAPLITPLTTQRWAKT